MKMFSSIFFVLMTVIVNSQNHQLNFMSKETKLDVVHCDTTAGVCAPNTVAKEVVLQQPISKKASIIYIGDPMCSWCWGIANELEQLKKDFQEVCSFQLVVGGLRPGGGDKWNTSFKQFLKKHWEHVHHQSGQAFSYDLLEKEQFNYDTEPACRAVRVVRDLAPEKEFDFFKAIQYRFYVENEDPTKIDFYEPLCATQSINFNEFKEKFTSTTYQQLVREDFAQSIEWGIRGFPSVILQQGEQLYLISSGYTTFQKMKNRVEQVIKN